MKSLAVEVSRHDGERTRQWLADRELVRRGLRIRRSSAGVQIPVERPVEVPGVVSTLKELEFEEARSGGPRRFRDLLPWPEDELERLPRAFDVVGDVVLVRLPDSLSGRAGEVGDALLRFVPGARVVGWDRGVRGTARLRAIEKIAGTGSFQTVHHENGLTFEVDLERAYFSPRLSREHARVAASVRSGETVYDLCCGVGPFTLLILQGGVAARVTSVDLNPTAIELLERNRARVRSRVSFEAVQADLETFLAEGPPADRVILNLPLEGIKYLTSVARVVSGPGTLHFYDVTRRAEADSRPQRLLDALDESRPGWRLVDTHRVHPYSPDADVVAYDFRCPPP